MVCGAYLHPTDLPLVWIWCANHLMSPGHGSGAPGGLSLSHSWAGIAVPCRVHDPLASLSSPNPPRTSPLGHLSPNPVSALPVCCNVEFPPAQWRCSQEPFSNSGCNSIPPWGPLPPTSSLITPSGTYLPKPRRESLPPSCGCSSREPSPTFH